MKRISKIIFILSAFVILLCMNSYAAGWLKIGNDMYWQNDDGSFYVGFVITDQGTYYCGPDGRMAKSNNPESWLLVNDELYQGKFFVDENGIVSMNDNNEPHWVKRAGQWFHYNKNGIMEKNKWIYDEKRDRIYRVDYEGHMCKGWVADPYTHIQYFMSTDEDGGHLIMDNLNSSYQESFDRLIAVINQDEKYDGREEPAPQAR